MIDSNILQDLVSRYREHCRKPTFNGLALLIGVSNKTVANVTHGRFNGIPYTDRPSATRCIGNDDFELIRGVFADEG